MAWPDSTISIDIDSPALLESTAPCLFLAFQCDRPTAPPQRYLLGGLGAVEFGRSHERGAEEVAEGNSARLYVRIPDPTMSSVHAELRRAGGGDPPPLRTRRGARRLQLRGGTSEPDRLRALRLPQGGLLRRGGGPPGVDPERGGRDVVPRRGRRAGAGVAGGVAARAAGAGGPSTRHDAPYQG